MPVTSDKFKDILSKFYQAFGVKFTTSLGKNTAIRTIVKFTMKVYLGKLA